VSTSSRRKSSFAGNERSRTTVLLVCALPAFNSIARIAPRGRLSAALKQPTEEIPAAVS
jgi:hypothetical protein